MAIWNGKPRLTPYHAFAPRFGMCNSEKPYQALFSIGLSAKPSLLPDAPD